MATLEKIKFLTVNYSRLQGLKAVPSGLLLFLIILWVNRQTGATRDLTLPLLWLAAGIGLYALIDWYYRRTYGRVEQHRKVFWKDVMFSILFMAIALAAFIVDTGAEFPLSAFAMVFAAGLLLDYLRMFRLAGVKTVTFFPVGLFCTAAIALSAFLPLFGKPTGAVFGFESPMLLVYAIDGIITVVYGVAGHLYLVRSMAAAGEEFHGQSV